MSDETTPVEVKEELTPEEGAIAGLEQAKAEAAAAEPTVLPPEIEPADVVPQMDVPEDPPWGDGPKPGTQGHTITPEASYAEPSEEPGILTPSAGLVDGPAVHRQPGDLPIGYQAEPLDPVERPPIPPESVARMQADNAPPVAGFVPPPPESELTEEELQAGYVPTVNAQNQWGPYKDYEVIATQYGEFGIPRSHIMRLTTKQVWDPKDGRYVMAVLPVFTPVKIKDSRTEPHPALVGQHPAAGAQMTPRKE